MKAAAFCVLLSVVSQHVAESTVPSCKYPSDKIGSEHAQVCYHIFEAAAPQGQSLAEKNCAPAGGDVFYAIEQRGIDPYYYKAGFIARINYGVTEWTRYAQCRHTHGSYNYNCHTLDVRAGCSNCTNMTTMEPEQNAFLSFPADGEDMYWSQVTELSGNCAAVIIRARCLFSLLAKAGVCPDGCHDKNAEECNACFDKLRHDEMIEVWHDAIEGGKCKRYTEREGDRDLPRPMPPTTRSALQDITAETGAPQMKTDGCWRFTPKDTAELRKAVYDWRTAPLSDRLSLYGDISSWNVGKITDMSYLFEGYGMENFHISSLSLWDVSQVTTMEGMFADSIGSVYLSTWDIGRVVNMKGMFRNASGFDDSNISSWDVSKVTNMESMFENSAGNVDLSEWDVSRVTQMRRMFRHATGFRSLNLSKWDVRATTDMTEMFAFSYGVKNLTNWDVSQVTNMQGMFRGSSQCLAKQHFPGCEDEDDDGDDYDYSTQPLHCPDLDLSKWDVSKVTNMAAMFRDALTFNMSGLHFWDVSKVTTMQSMFEGAESFNGNIDNWHVSSVTDMTRMFARAIRFNFSLQGWDVSNVESMDFMFNNAESFNGSIGHWDVSNVHRISRMFWGATVFNRDISGWDVSRITDMSYMFMEARHFNGDLSKWDVSRVTTMDSMFQGAWNFNTSLASWKVSKVTNMYSMFSQAEAFNSSVTNWDVSAVTEMDDMFLGAISFHSDIKNWKVSQNATSSRMFRDVACKQCALVPRAAGHHVAHNCHYYCEDTPERSHAPPKGQALGSMPTDEDNMMSMTKNGKSMLKDALTTESTFVV